MSSENLIFYTYKKCFHSRLVQVMSKFTNTKLDVVFLDTMSENNIRKLSSKSPTGTFPLLQLGEFFLSGTVAITKFLLAGVETLSSVLLGNENKRKALNDTWVDFTVYNVWPFYDEIIGQITGKLDAHEGLFSTAIIDFMQVLKKVNINLTFKTFLVDHHVSFADLVLAVALYPYFTLVLDEKLRSEVPNVERLFLYVANLKEVASVLGKPRLCFKTQKPAVVPMLKLTAPIQTKPVVEKQQKEKKPEQPKKVEKKPEAKPAVEEAEVKEAKKQNPLDKLPPTTVDLDAFKKEFLNTPHKKEVLDKFWKIYDANGWSIWYLYYNKSADQGKITFRTCNLKSNFLQKLEKFRRYTFSVHGVYGVEPNLEVCGVWMWRGTEIPEELKEHDSYDYITFKKLDVEKDKDFIEEFWLNLNEGQIVNGLPVVEAETFK